MILRTASPSSDPIREAELLVAVAKELHRLADEAMEQARAACARVNVFSASTPGITMRVALAEHARDLGIPDTEIDAAVDAAIATAGATP